MADSDYTGSPIHIYLQRPTPFYGTNVHAIAGRVAETLGSLLVVTRVSSVCDETGTEVSSPLLGRTIMLPMGDIRLVVMTTVGAPPPTEPFARA